MGSTLEPGAQNPARRVKIGAMVAGWESADVSRFGELLEQFNGSMVDVDVAADVATGIGR